MATALSVLISMAVGNASDANARDATRLPRLGPVNTDITTMSGAQSQASVAVSPTDQNHIIASCDNWTTPAQVLGYESWDGGVTWTKVPIAASTSSRTWCAFNAAGDAFLAFEDLSTSSPTQLGIAYKNAGSGAWFTNSPLPGAGSNPVSVMCSVDRGTSAFAGSVYLGYADMNSSSAYALYSRTGKGVATWARSDRIDDAATSLGTLNAYVLPARDASGVVYAAWEELQPTRLWCDKSLDGGATWGTDHLITNLDAPLQAGATFHIAPQTSGVTLGPRLAIAPPGSPFAGRLYCVYTDRKITSTSETSVFVQYSNDGGLTWSPRVSLVSAIAGVEYAFAPAPAVLEDGTVGVAFYATVPNSSPQCLYVMVSSTDGGDTWTPASQLSDMASDETLPFADPIHQFGLHAGFDAAPGGSFVSAWTGSNAAYSGLAEELMFAFVYPPFAAPRAKLSRHQQAAVTVDGTARQAMVTVHGSSFRLDLPVAGHTTFEVFDATGRRRQILANGVLPAGTQTFQIALPHNGLYFYKCRVGDYNTSGKFVLHQ